MKDILNIQTPYYIIDEEKLNINVTSMIDSFKQEWNNFIFSYSFKTNSLPWILDWMKQKGAYAEVVSNVEYDLALELGYSADKIVINGPYKGLECLKFALNNNSIVNLDSFHEIEWIKKNKPDNGIWKVGLRINFDLELECPNETIMGSEPGRFGFNLENKSFERAVKELEALDYVKIVGIHGHHSTKTKSLKIFKSISKKIVFISKVINNTLEYVDIGGCFFGDKPGAPTFLEYAKVICDELRTVFSPSETALIVEPGAAVIASPISYVCKIIDKKEINNKLILSTDGSSLNIDPQMHGIKFFIESFGSGERVKEQIIGGYTCIEKDRMAVLDNEKALNIGDFIKFHNTGAYSMALTPLFIQYFPTVIVKRSDKLFYARKPWGVKEYMCNNYLGYNEVIKEC